MSKVTDEQTQLSDRDWWQEAGNHLNLELHGWTFRNNASFIDRETRQYVALTGTIAARLIALQAASSTPDGEAVADMQIDAVIPCSMSSTKQHEWFCHEGNGDMVCGRCGNHRQWLVARIRFDTERPPHTAGEIEAGGEVAIDRVESASRLRQWARKHFGLWITHSTAKRAIDEILALKEVRL